MTTSIKAQDLGLPKPSPSTPFVVLKAGEAGGDCFVEYQAWGNAERVRLRFDRLIGARMDAYCCEAARANLSIGEILHSRWLAECAARQAKQHPDSPDTLDGIRHFFVKGHDTTVEVLAEDCTRVRGGTIENR